MATILVCYGGHIKSKMAAKIQKSSDLGKILFPCRLWCCEMISIVCFAMAAKMAAKIQKSSDLRKIWFPSIFCSCELISVIVFGIGSHIMILQIISYLVIIIPLFSSASILSGTFLGNRTAYPFETWNKNRSSLKVVHLVFKIFKMAANILKSYKKTQIWS